MLISGAGVPPPDSLPDVWDAMTVAVTPWLARLSELIPSVLAETNWPESDRGIV